MGCKREIKKLAIFAVEGKESAPVNSKGGKGAQKLRALCGGKGVTPLFNGPVLESHKGLVTDAVK